MPAVPERLRWAVETIAVQPDDEVLEIGCGGGVSAALVCERLEAGRMLAIDRSTTQIERARTRNAAHVAAGRLELETVDVADLDVGARRFDTVFAVNVNVFWLAPARQELERIRGALSPGGTLFLFYETPSATRAEEAAEGVARALAGAGFAGPDLLRLGPTMLSCVSRPEG